MSTCHEDATASMMTSIKALTHEGLIIANLTSGEIMEPLMGEDDFNYPQIGKREVVKFATSMATGQRL